MFRLCWCLLIAFSVTAYAAAGVPVVVEVENGTLMLSSAGPASGTLVELKQRDALLGFGVVEQSPTRVTVLAGKGEKGAEVLSVAKPLPRIGYLGDDKSTRIENELKTLYPGRVVDLKDAGSLESAGIDALVLAKDVPREPIERFVAGGRPAVVELAVYAKWHRLALRPCNDPVEVMNETPTTRGLAKAQRLSWHGAYDGNQFGTALVHRQTRATPLLAFMPGQNALAVEETIGKGRLLAIDLATPNGEPGFGPGSTLKWILPGNLIGGSVHYTDALSKRLDYERYLQVQEQAAADLGDDWAYEKVGTDSGGRTIRRFRRGPLDRPIVFINGSIHGGEWVNPYILLEFVRYLDNPPVDDYKTRWFLKHFMVIVVPMLSGSMTQESTNGCDLNRNFDFRWEDYVKDGGWRAGREAKLKGTEPFSEPETRVVRDHVFNLPVIGYFDMHMHGMQWGPMLMGTALEADPDPAPFMALGRIANACLAGRFLWAGPKQAQLRISVPGKSLKPFSQNWAGHQGVWAGEANWSAGHRTASCKRKSAWKRSSHSST